MQCWELIRLWLREQLFQLVVTTCLEVWLLESSIVKLFVNVVLKRDTILPQPYDGVELMADALNMPIAWPYQRVIHMFMSFFQV